jgi:peroxiredoxin
MRQTLYLLACIAICGTFFGSIQAEEPTTRPAAAEKEPVVYQSAEEVKPLKPGSALPRAKVRDLDGEEHELKDILGEDSSILIFFRGGWCPFCTAHLAELAAMQGELDSRGAKILAFSPDTPEHLSKTVEEKELSYKLYSDSDHHAMKAMGIAFAVDEPTDEALRGYGVDLAEWSGNEERVLPVPAVFVVDGDRKIRFTYAEPDYRVRISVEELLAALDGEGKARADDGDSCCATD